MKKRRVHIASSSYDAAGNLASMSSSHTNGVSVSYTYDAQNRLSTVVDGRLGSGANTTTYTYDPASNVANVTYPNWLSNETYDSNGNTLTTGGKSFTYDSENHLTSMNGGRVAHPKLSLFPSQPSFWVPHPTLRVG